MGHLHGCLAPMLQHFLEPVEKQRLMAQSSYPKQVWEKLDFTGKVTISLLDECELNERAKVRSPGTCGPITMAVKACTSWISACYKRTRACAEGLIDDAEPAFVVQTMNDAPSTTADLIAPPQQQFDIPDPSRSEESSSKTQNVQGNDSYLACMPVTDHQTFANFHYNKHQGLDHKSLLCSRSQHQFEEELICVYSDGNKSWKAFNLRKNSWIDLPEVSTGLTFDFADKISLAAGSHLLWIGKELFDYACYKYDHLSRSWERGPSMVTPRCLFGSATCGQYAFLAGGFAVDGLLLNILSSAERYDSAKGLWESLAPMRTPRQSCSAFFMDEKFYVIGGKSINHQHLTCGEVFDPSTNVWRIIEDMYPEPSSLPAREPAPPLVAVANNELYMLETTSNLLKVYEKGTNSWRVLGGLPVRVDISNGWDLAFKALGDRLFLIGGENYSLNRSEGISVFSCIPQPAQAPKWQLVSSGNTGIGNFLFSCTVMAF